MSPFCDPTGGGLQEADMVSAPVATSLKLVGGLLGPAM